MKGQTKELYLGTVEDHELIDPTLTSEQLLYRLYHEDGVRIFDPRNVAAGCPCQRQSLLTVLKQFSDQEKEDMAKDGIIEATCEFCNTTYTFETSNI